MRGARRGPGRLPVRLSASLAPLDPRRRARRLPTAPRGAGRRPWTYGLPPGPAAPPRPSPPAPALSPAPRALRVGPARGRSDMGAKQSGPAAANGRTRAYSGSDLPSSSGGGANGTAGGGGARAAAAGRFPAQGPGAHQPGSSGGAAAAAAAPRSRSLGGAVGTVASGARAAQSSFSIPNSSSGQYGSQDSVHSSPEDGSAGGGGGGRDRPSGGGPGGPRLVIGSLPAHLSPHLFGGTAPSLPGFPAPAGGTWAAAAFIFTLLLFSFSLSAGAWPRCPARSPLPGGKSPLNPRDAAAART